LLLASACRNAEHYYQRGLHSDHPRLRRDYLDRALDLDPDHLEARRLRGRLLLEAGELERAQEDIDRALALVPGDPETLARRGSVLARRGELEAAERELASALAAGGDQLAEVLVRRGMLDELRGDLASAATSYDRAVALDATHAPAYFQRGRLRFREGDLESARADLRIAADRGTGVMRADARQDFALTFFAASDVVGARQALEQAHRELPALAGRWLYLLGSLHHLRGDYESAGACFAEAHVQRYQRHYCYLFLAMVSQRVYGQSHRELAVEILANEVLQGWPTPILQAFAGQLTVEQTLAAATSDSERCEAAYFLGERALLVGDVTAARTHFSQAASAADPLLPEFHLAVLRTKQPLETQERSR
jgi:tetratricopeptide (TPR) repeat protein